MSRRDGLRLALGTLTIVPVRPPRTVDRASAAWAMTFAPLVGLLLALAATIFAWLLGWSAAPPLVASALTIGMLALVTRGIHLDGLADTADGLGSGKPADEALAIMRKSDIGPFGVVTVVLMLLVQVGALASLLTTGRGAFALVLGLVVSRLVLPLVCSRGIAAARADGLGQAVAGSVSRAQLALAIVLGGVVTLGFVLAGRGFDTDLLRLAFLGVGVAAVALAAGAAVCWWCVRRLGGITGDVMGACVEVTFTVALVVLTMV